MKKTLYKKLTIAQIKILGKIELAADEVRTVADRLDDKVTALQHLISRANRMGLKIAKPKIDVGDAYTVASDVEESVEAINEKEQEYWDEKNGVTV